MDTYSWMREFADSWFLIAMTLFYVGACLRVFLPSRRAPNAEAADIPFRYDTPDAGNCGGNCSACKCQSFKLEDL